MIVGGQPPGNRLLCRLGDQLVANSFHMGLGEINCKQGLSNTRGAIITNVLSLCLSNFFLSGLIEWRRSSINKFKAVARDTELINGGDGHNTIASLIVLL